MNLSDTVIVAPAVPEVVAQPNIDTSRIIIPRHEAPADADAAATQQAAPPRPVQAPRPVQRVVIPYLPGYGPENAPVATAVTPPPTAADSIAAFGLPADSIAADSIAHRPTTFGITLTPAEVPTMERQTSDGYGMSIILVGMLALFCIVGLRFRNNRKYVTSLVRNLMEVRVRHNVFDETVRETTFLVLLNLLWSCSAGIILYWILVYTVPQGIADSFGIRALRASEAESIGVCMAIGVCYTCFMSLAYYVVGTVFSDNTHARLWLKGFTASQGLLSFIYFPLSLVFLFYPGWTGALLWVAGVTFLIAKVIFIWKGFRIFFTQISSWVLFLYYLCSLEIVPLILTYLAAIQLCSLLP